MPDVGPAIEVRRWQLLIALVFLGVVGWCLLAPMTVIDLTVRPEHQDDLCLTAVSVGAFGAQAMLPLFAFDCWFYAIEPLFNELILLDVAGNLAMLGACARGWWLLGTDTLGASRS